MGLFSQQGNTASNSIKLHSGEIDKKITDLLAKMTLEEKIGQMTQVALGVISQGEDGNGIPHKIDGVKLREAVVKYKVGSILNVIDGAYTIEHWHEIIQAIQDTVMKETPLKIPVLYGIDSIHGANYVVGSTIFPQNIGMAATFNGELVKKCAQITAYETRAAGLPWNFGPVLDMGRQPLWPRLFETFGEDTYLASIMAHESIKGMEGDNNLEKIDNTGVAACMKHYLGYGFPLSGKDRTPAWIPLGFLKEYFVPPFETAVKAGAHTLMVNSSEINGEPVHASRFYLKTLLREELGFEGLVVSDWKDIQNLHTREKVASSQKEAVKLAVMAGVDMSMVPSDFSFYEYLLELVKEGEVPVSRIDEAVRRILMVKFKLGLFENPYWDKALAAGVGSAENTQTALEAARESITLLKNDGVLPLAGGTRVLVTGPTADRLSVMSSGWTYTWQGNDEKRYPVEKDTIREALEKRFSKNNVVYEAGCLYDKEVDIRQALNKAKTVDVIVACLGEEAYCETPGNIDDLALPGIQYELVSKLCETGKPVILVMVEGRPRLIRGVVDKVKAVVMGYLPGNEGGRAIAEILAGDVNPSGKLPITYPRFANDLKCYDYKNSEVSDVNRYNPEFRFGYGLSYTEFTYEKLVLDKRVMEQNDGIEISVTVKNSGKVKGKEAVLLYVRDLVASVTPSVQRLKGFRKVELAPGEEKVVVFRLSPADLSFIGLDMKPTVEPGGFQVMVGSLTADFTLSPSSKN